MLQNCFLSKHMRASSHLPEQAAVTPQHMQVPLEQAARTLQSAYRAQTSVTATILRIRREVNAMKQANHLPVSVQHAGRGHLQGQGLEVHLEEACKSLLYSTSRQESDLAAQLCFSHNIMASP